MSGNLIDTNVIIKLLNGNQEVAKLMNSLDQINISVVSAGELYYGAQKSSRIEQNMNLFKEFISEFPIIDIDEDISYTYAIIKAGLVQKGINIPENDLWIAATALFNNYSLVTYDEHFKNIDGLQITR